jgi:cyanate permease
MLRHPHPFPNSILISIPPHIGTLGTCNQFAMVIGILMSDVLAFPLANEAGWRYLFGFTAMPALLQLALSFLIAETPRFLIMNNKTTEAVKVF